MDKITLLLHGDRLCYDTYDPDVFRILRINSKDVTVNSLDDNDIHMVSGHVHNHNIESCLGYRKLIDMSEFGKTRFLNIVREYNIPFPPTVIARGIYNIQQVMDYDKVYVVKTLRGANSEAVVEVDATLYSNMLNYALSLDDEDYEEFNNRFDIIGSEQLFMDIKHERPLQIQDRVNVKNEYRVIVGYAQDDYIVEKRINYPHGPDKSHHILFKNKKRLNRFITDYLKPIVYGYDLPYCSFDVLEDKDGNFLVIEITKSFGTSYVIKKENVKIRDYLTSSLYQYIKNKEWIE